MNVKSETRQRTRLVAVRMTDDEHDRYQALADRKGWALPQLMRLAVEAALMQEQVREYTMAGRGSDG